MSEIALCVYGIIFHNGNLSGLVQSLPAIEVFKLADFSELGYKPKFKGVDGLTLDVLSVVSGWKNLKECVLVVDVPANAVARKDAI